MCDITIEEDNDVGAIYYSYFMGTYIDNEEIAWLEQIANSSSGYLDIVARRNEKRSHQQNENVKTSHNIIKKFSNEGILNLSRNAALYYLNDEQFYHVIQNGQMLSFLYVSKYQEKWEHDRNDLKESYLIAYVANLTNELCSEFGSIGI